MKTTRTYSLEWLDSLVWVTLNPERPYRNKLQEDEIISLIEKVPLECQQVELELTDKIFSLYKDSQVLHLVQKYHDTLITLREATAGYKSKPAPDKLRLLEMQVVKSLEGLLNFIKNRYPQYLKATSKVNISAEYNDKDRAATASSGNKYKILCTLSGDQIALILRGADEAQVIKARSMNAVFKSIVPFLSTEHKENLSADSIRSKAYNPEEADCDAAISALQAIIRKIQSY